MFRNAFLMSDRSIESFTSLYSYMLLYVIKCLHSIVFKFKFENLKKRHLSITKNACIKCFFPINTKSAAITWLFFFKKSNLPCNHFFFIILRNFAVNVRWLYRNDLTRWSKILITFVQHIKLFSISITVFLESYHH